MRSGKLIDISKSSLISLKAELTRKQEEIKKVKEQESFIKLPPKPKTEIKTNPGVEKRNENDLELNTEEVDLLKKSREVLEIKASIYEKCQKGELISKDEKSHYLVDFERKSPEPGTSQPHFLDKPLASPNVEGSVIEAEEEDDNNDDQIEDYELDSEWVEYTDCLGRTRTCHRSDLPMMKFRDKSLAQQLNVEKNESEQGERDSGLDSSQLQERELLSKDMHLEELRKKWEEQEKKLANKEDIHYEDILFDEARSHGVGYWAFSTDAEKRAAEQEMFKKVRAETEQRQQEAAALRRRRDEQRQARLIAARERQRARLGLPPISTEDLKQGEQLNVEEQSVENVIQHVQEKTADDLQRKLMRAAHVRPWDIGKDKVKEPVMTQEEWIEKKRAERNDEFAPIHSSPPRTNVVKQFAEHPKKKLLPKQREYEISSTAKSESVSRAEPSGAQNNFFSARNEAIYSGKRGLGTEIPPPVDLQTPGPSTKRKFTSFEETAAAIEAGLKYLREEQEKSQNAPTKGTYNMI